MTANVEFELGGVESVESSACDVAHSVVVEHDLACESNQMKIIVIWLLMAGDKKNLTLHIR